MMIKSVRTRIRSNMNVYMYVFLITAPIRKSCTMDGLSTTISTTEFGNLIKTNTYLLDDATPEDLIYLANDTDGLLRRSVDASGVIRADIADAVVDFIDDFTVNLAELATSNISFADEVVYEFVLMLADVCDVMIVYTLNISNMSTRVIASLERAFEDSAELISNISHNVSINFRFRRTSVSGMLDVCE